MLDVQELLEQYRVEVKGLQDQLNRAQQESVAHAVLTQTQVSAPSCSPVMQLFC